MDLIRHFSKNHTNGQLAHEILFNVTNLGNANQNHVDISYPLVWLRLKKNNNLNCSQNVNEEIEAHTLLVKM